MHMLLLGGRSGGFHGMLNCSTVMTTSHRQQPVNGQATLNDSATSDQGPGNDTGYVYIQCLLENLQKIACDVVIRMRCRVQSKVMPCRVVVMFASYNVVQMIPPSVRLTAFTFCPPTYDRVLHTWFAVLRPA